MVETEIEIEKLEVSPQNVRKEIAKDKDDLGVDEMAESIRQTGLLQPIVVRPRPDGKYEIVIGQLRYLAYKKLGLKKIRAVVQEMDDRTALKQSLTENLLSIDISPMEKARAFEELCEGRTQTEVARELGISQATISNYLCLLKLAPELQVKASSMDRTSQLQALRRISRDFKSHEEQLGAAKKIEGLSQKEALYALEQARGDIKRLEQAVGEVALKSFLPGYDLCRGLEDCPLVPKEVREKVLSIVRAYKSKKPKG